MCCKRKSVILSRDGYRAVLAIFFKTSDTESELRLNAGTIRKPLADPWGYSWMLVPGAYRQIDKIASTTRPVRRAVLPRLHGHSPWAYIPVPKAKHRSARL